MCVGSFVAQWGWCLSAGGGPGPGSLPLASHSGLPSHSYYVPRFVPDVVGTARGSQTGNTPLHTGRSTVGDCGSPWGAPTSLGTSWGKGGCLGELRNELSRGERPVQDPMARKGTQGPGAY